jgi:hypothetical protein
LAPFVLGDEKPGRYEMRSIPSVVIYSLLLIGANAHSAPEKPILLVEEPIGSATDVTTQFEVNHGLGRAWIRIEFAEGRNTQGPSPVKTVRKAVEGLSYDPNIKSVVERIGADTIVCAEDVQFLWTKSLRATGNCPICVSVEERVADDGFETRKQTVAKVVMLPQHKNGLVSRAR